MSGYSDGFKRGTNYIQRSRARRPTRSLRSSSAPRWQPSVPAARMPYADTLELRLVCERICESGDQCCPMDTYDTDSAGDLHPVCSCGDDCPCMCLDCICEAWGDDERMNWLPDE